MSKKTVEDLIERWMADPFFNHEMRVDPEAAIQRHHFDLTEEELAALRDLDLSQSDEELAQRISFAG